jgi:hypothetical protein
MSDEERRKETYDRIKKRLGEYRYRSALLTLGTLAFALLFVFSLFPLVPVIIAIALGLTYSVWTVPLWFLCIGIFGALFWVFQRVTKMTEEKRGVTLEEKMYIPAYEALCYFREYFDPNHPIKGSKLKAERRMEKILTLLGESTLPNVIIIREEAVQLWQLWKNLKMRLIPSMEKNNGSIDSSLVRLVDYLSKPELTSLVRLNEMMLSLSEINERNIYLDFRRALLKSSNLRHMEIVLVTSITALLIYYTDLNYFGANLHEAFALGIGSLIALMTLYVTYLALTKRREP